ncbi:riboflavin synthase, partial [uncultured Senegalimassilia sp.]|uniref:riboflavin synthase n=1 Tax=uncultured Senegalimassilia sp. TaxID=1714350 RepID=UPI002618574B
MFTGIVEELGRIVRVPSPGRAGQLEIAATRVLTGTNIGDSIAVNGVCLTATTVSAAGFTADVMPQTLAHSNLGALRAGSPVNLERAMAADGRFGGHIVSGHIDGTGTIRRIRRDQNAVRFAIEAPASIMALIVQRGS